MKSAPSNDDSIDATRIAYKTIMITKDTPGWEDSDIWRERIYIDGKEVETRNIDVTTVKDRELRKKLEAYLLERSRINIDKSCL